MSALRLLKPAASVLNIQWMPFPAVDLRVLASLRHRHPILYTAHDTMMGNTSTVADPTADLLRRLDPDLIVVHTRQGLTRLMGRGFDESRLFLVPHPPLALPPAAAAPQDIQAEKAVFQIAMIGEVKAYKGYDTAFKALAALPEDIARRIRFQVSGRPFFDVEALRDQLLPPSRRDLVRFDLRYLSEEEFGRALDETDCLLLPYQEIEASGVLYTALARARMILASDVGAFGEILPEEYLVPVADDAALARKLIDLVSQPDARAARAERLREVARVHLSGSEFDSRLLAAFDLVGQKFRARVSRP
jgi:glycosyltransferase involved in cell wall biosynthesis